MISQADRDILRALAEKIAEAAARPEQAEKARLWLACNRLRPERAMVYVDPQNGWAELVPQSALMCRGQWARDVEWSLRRTEFRIDHIADDCPIVAEFAVHASIQKSGYGAEGRLIYAPGGGAYHIDPPIKRREDFLALHANRLRYDEAGTMEQLGAMRELLGDLLQVKWRGVDFFRCGLTRILVHLRGLDQLMYDLYDEPELLHDMMAFLRDEQIKELDYYEANRLLSFNVGPSDVNGSGGLGYTDEIDLTGPATCASMRVWGESQEFVGVGPGQFEEFVLRYQLPILNRFALVDYGCCEPLDTKFELLKRHLPHLRWVAVSPWCDRAVAADALGADYVYVYKPNPSRVCSPKADLEGSIAEVRQTLAIARGCPMHIVLKDTSTFCGQPQRVSLWAREAVKAAEQI